MMSEVKTRSRVWSTECVGWFSGHPWALELAQTSQHQHGYWSPPDPVLGFSNTNQRLPPPARSQRWLDSGRDGTTTRFPVLALQYCTIFFQSAIMQSEQRFWHWHVLINYKFIWEVQDYWVNIYSNSYTQYLTNIEYQFTAELTQIIITFISTHFVRPFLQLPEQLQWHP